MRQNFRSFSPPFARPSAILAAAVAMVSLGGIARATNTVYVGPAAGNWDTPANWSAGVPNNGTPSGVTYDAFIDNGAAQNSVVTISSSITRTVDHLTITSGDTLNVSNNTFLQLTGGGTALTNNGTLNLNSTGSSTRLRFLNGGTITGTGTINLTGSALIDGSGAVSQLAGHTIIGEGNIGGSSISFNNAGTIIATGTLTLDPINLGNTNEFTNTGTLRASGGGLLQLTGSGDGRFNTVGGTVEALNGSNVRLVSSARVNGGTFQTTGSGTIGVAVSDDGFFNDFTNTGNMVGENNSDFGIAGIVNNTGTISLNSTGSATDLELQNNTTFNGTGTIVLNGPNAGINGSGLLTNSATHTIRGEGRLGQASVTINNAGLVNANVTGGTLTIDPINTGTTTEVTNSGTLRASNGGFLTITGSGDGRFLNTATGVIEATGAGSEVRVANSARITGGTVRGVSGGVVYVPVSNNGFFTNLTLTGAIEARNNSDFIVNGSISHTGTLDLVSEGSSTDLTLDASTTFTGSGTIRMMGAGQNARINGSGTFTQSTGHTIEGQGQIGAAAITVVNNGLINSNVAGGTITLDPVNTGTTNEFINTATMQATNGATLLISGSGDGRFLNTGGFIDAQTGSEVQFTIGANVRGGTLRTFGTGVLRNNVSQDVFLTDLTIAGNLVSDNNSDLGIDGTITNNGQITLDGGGSTTSLEVQSDATLAGTGTVVLAGTGAQIDGTGRLIVSAGQTIQGRGAIGAAAIAVTNNGLIVANSGVAALTIDPINTGSATEFINNGTLRAAGGLLVLSGSGDGRFVNNSVIEALGTSEVRLANNVFVSGGTITSAPGAVVRVTTSDTANVANLTVAANVVVNNNADLRIDGTVTNNGTITLLAAGSTTDIEVQSDATLAGTGAVILSGTNDRIVGTGRLTNGVGHTVSGSGQLGAAAITITNQGIITSDAGATLTVDPINVGSTNEVINDTTGVLRAENGSTLALSGSGDGRFNNAGTIEALTGSTVSFPNSGILNNNTGGTLTGGTYRAVTTGAAATVNLPGGNVSTLAAKVVMSGANASIPQVGSSLTSISAAGALTLDDGKIFTAGPTLANAGVVTVGTTGTPAGSATSLATGTLTNTGTLAGTGTVIGNVVSTGTVAPGSSAGTLSVTGNFTQTTPGNYAVELASLANFDRLAITGMASLGGTLSVSTITPFAPVAGNSFVILTAAGGVMGQFSNVPAGYTVTYTPTTVVLNTLVPEPTSLGLLGLGVTTLLRRRRKA